MEERDRLYYAHMTHMTACDADREPTTLIVMRVRDVASGCHCTDRGGARWCSVTRKWTSSPG